MTVWVLLIATGVLFAAVAAVPLIGRRLPLRHEASRGLRLGRQPQAVWSVITDTDGFTAWRPGLTRAESLDGVDGRARWIEHDRHGKITYEVVEADAPRRFVTRIADTGLPFGGTWTWTIEPRAQGCLVTVTEHGEIYNPLFRFVSRYIIGYGATMERILRALAKHFGEDPVLEKYATFGP
ncbi:uncharacterized protein YndB with AHSA1/START domain [Catenulispora sp. GP43]|uniref:SRPBCC family protein n=1 Tax=Catenulispora sp. GP43 TaxID=3156263 RepID=UPI0035110247